MTDTLFWVIYIVAMLAAWLVFAWPRLLRFAVDWHEPDTEDYMISGVLSFMLVLVWPVSTATLLGAWGLSRLGPLLYGRQK